MGRRVRAADGKLTEAAFQSQVEALARFYGWLVYHPPDNRPVGDRGRRQRTKAGYPDLTMVRGNELIVAELKRDTTYPSAAQREWLDALALVAAELRAFLPHTDEPGVDVDPDLLPRFDVYLWRPRDFEAIQARLARGRQIVPAGFDPRA